MRAVLFCVLIHIFESLITEFFLNLSDKTLENGTRILVNPCNARGLYCGETCLHQSKICNGVIDCPSGADEQVCTKKKGL